MATKTNVKIKGIEIPMSSHPEIKKLKKHYNVHSMHGNKVWNSTLVFLDAFDEVNVKGKTFADLGCGWGAMSCYLQKKGGIVTGFDQDETVKPYFDLMCKLMDSNPKFVQQDIFDDTLPMDFDVYIACDVCFWKNQVDCWIELIDKLAFHNKQLIMCDPGRQSFWELVDYCQVPHFLERKYIEEPRKTDAYITVFGFDHAVEEITEKS